MIAERAELHGQNVSLQTSTLPFPCPHLDPDLPLNAPTPAVHNPFLADALASRDVRDKAFHVAASNSSAASSVHISGSNSAAGTPSAATHPIIQQIPNEEGTSEGGPSGTQNVDVHSRLGALGGHADPGTFEERGATLSEDLQYGQREGNPTDAELGAEGTAVTEYSTHASTVARIPSTNSTVATSAHNMEHDGSVGDGEGLQVAEKDAENRRKSLRPRAAGRPLQPPANLPTALADRHHTFRPGFFFLLA